MCTTQFLSSTEQWARESKKSVEIVLMGHHHHVRPTPHRLVIPRKIKTEKYIRNPKEVAREERPFTSYWGHKGLERVDDHAFMSQRSPWAYTREPGVPVLGSYSGAYELGESSGVSWYPGNVLGLLGSYIQKNTQHKQ